MKKNKILSFQLTLKSNFQTVSALLCSLAILNVVGFGQLSFFVTVCTLVQKCDVVDKPVEACALKNTLFTYEFD